MCLHQVNGFDTLKKIPTIFYDLIALGCLLAVNPIITHFNQSIRKATEDIILCLAMAEQAIPKGLLFLPGWEHVDKGIILPPVFPSLISLGQLISANSLAIAEILSHLSMLLTAICVYFCTKLLTNRVCAVVASIVVQTSYYYMLLGFQPLPEAFFACLLCITVLCVFYLMRSQKNMLLPPLGLGLISALLFLTMPAGLIIFPFLIIWSILYPFSQKSYHRKWQIKHPLLIGIGFILIAGPYLLTLYSQTGQSPGTKYFRLNEYAIRTEDPFAIETIQKFSEDISESHQNNMFRQKSLLTLLEDSSEMLKDVVVPDNLKQASKRGTPTLITQNFQKNFSNFLIPLSGFLKWLFFISLITPFVVIARNSPARLRRLFLPLLLLGYMAGISFLGDTADTQVFLLYPLVIIHVATEIYHSAGRIREVIPATKNYVACGVAASLVFLLLGYILPTRLYKEFSFPTQKNTPIIEKIFVSEIKRGEPAFSVNAVDAYRAGLSFRTLPNDSLEKISKYGRATGVRFLLYDWKNPNNLLYDQATWMRGPGLIRSEHLKSIYQKGSLSLYELQDSDKV
jgi:4-amino-4-deoxy-L-arabinose transferase-like glycosyltransferase